MNHLSYDVIILGGGIAGLWLLSQLQKQGYNALLLEAHALGAGQTILSQGIIHGGTKYAVKEALTSLARHIKTMPERWQQCLQGSGEIDLHETQLFAEHQHLWTPHQISGKFVGFLTSAVMRSRVTKLKRNEFPDIFQNNLFLGDVYSLNEPVLNIFSLLNVFQKKYATALAKINAEKTEFIFENEKLEKIKLNDVTLSAKKFIFTTGQYNDIFLKKFHLEKIKTQRRPLRMLLLKTVSFPLFAHCVDMHFKPRLTITSYPLEKGYAWYIGGEVAEKGAHMSPEETFQFGISELQQLFPWILFENSRWKTYYIDRAEPWQANGKIPPIPSFTSHHNMMFAWPVKLAYSPLLSEEILSHLQKEKILPSHQPTFHPYTQPPVALPPWNDNVLWN